jgi:hypothetical protein
MNLRAHLVAIPANGRTQVEVEILWATPKAIPEEAHPLFQDAFGRTPPTGVDHDRDPANRIHQEYRNAVGHRHRHEDILLVRRMTIPVGPH